MIRCCRNCIKIFTPLLRYLTEYCTHRLNAEKSERLLRNSQSIYIVLRSTVYVLPMALPPCRPSTCKCVRDLTRAAWQAAGFAPFTKPSPHVLYLFYINMGNMPHTVRPVCLSHFLSLFSTYSARRKIFHNKKKLFHDGYFIHYFVNFLLLYVLPRLVRINF